MVFTLCHNCLKQNINFCFEKSNEQLHTTTVSLGTSVILAPGDVNPGHIIFAPLRTNLIAPLSTCCIGKKKGTKKIEI